MRRFIVDQLDNACAVVDRMPSWTYWPVKRWLGCPSGMARWAVLLEDRWGLDSGYRPMTAAEIAELDTD